MLLINFPLPCTDMFTAVGVFNFHDDYKNLLGFKTTKKRLKTKFWKVCMKSNQFAQSAGSFSKAVT